MYQKVYEHITPVLMQLHWLPVRYRIIFKVCLLIFKCLNGLCPLYLYDLVATRPVVRSTRSASDVTLLIRPRAKLVSAGDRMFSVIGPELWNQLPKQLREASNVDTFKAGLKTNLFKRAFLNH